MSSNYPPVIYSLRRVAEQDIASGAARGYAPIDDGSSTVAYRFDANQAIMDP